MMPTKHSARNNTTSVEIYHRSVPGKGDEPPTDETVTVGPAHQESIPAWMAARLKADGRTEGAELADGSTVPADFTLFG